MTQRSPKDNPDFFRSRTDYHPAAMSTLNEMDDLLLDSNEMVRRLEEQQSKKMKKKDIFDDLKLFKDLTDPVERRALKQAFKQDEFEAGDIIFNYRALRFSLSPVHWSHSISLLSL